MILADIVIQLTDMYYMKNAALIVLVSLSLSASLFCKKTEKTNEVSADAVEIKDSVIVSNLNFPWEILWAPDNFIWMTERGGKISRVNPATGAVSVVFTINEVVSTGEGGLLGMTLHPNFSSTPHVFVVYDYDNGSGYKEKIVRYTYNGTSLSSPVTIIDNINASNIHNGSRLAISPDLKLFISTGDATNQGLPQNISSVNGKILRLNLDGSIPSDNPVPGNPYWSYGHRNPQGLVYANNTLYSSEHGPTTDDEINIIEKGKNYGWPDVRGFCDESSEQNFCNSHIIKQPLKVWTPTAAVSGMDYYNKDLIPQWKNSLLVVALKNARLYQLRLDNAHSAITETNEFLTNKYGRMRDLCISPEGKVYICTSNGGNDKIIAISGK